MNVVEGVTFKNQEIIMDFTVWRKCNFVNCQIKERYGILTLDNNDFINCTWLFPKNTPADTIKTILEMIGYKKV